MKTFRFNSRWRTTLTAFVTMGLLVLQYQNCSNYADPSPFDGSSLINGAANSSPTQVKLDSPVGVLDVGEYDLTMATGGECNVGLSSKHMIEVRLLDSSNQPIAVREDSLCPKDATVGLDAECFRATQFRCEHGRYSVVLPLSCNAYRYQSQGVYRLVGQMVTYDKDGLEVRDNKAGFERFFTIAWAPNACP